MVKRKAAAVVERVEPAGPASYPKAKKNKSKRDVQEQPVIEKPLHQKNDKLKVRSEKQQLNASLASMSSPGKKGKNHHHKQDKNDGISESALLLSPKRMKYKKERDSMMSSPKSPVKPVIDEIHEHEDHFTLDPPSHGEDTEIVLLEIPKGDLETLLGGIKRLLPECDSIAPKVRAKKLDWRQVAFHGYPPERCAKIWDVIQKKQRQYRYMAELVDDAVAWLETPWRSAKSKSTKHPDYPKRPQSAFLLFLHDAKAGIMREHQDAKMTEISRIAGQKFKELPDSARRAYLERAAVDMRKHEAAVELFYKKHPQLRAEMLPKYAGPRKARSPFALFLADHMSKEEHVADKTAYRMASKEAWSNMKAKRKLPWIRRAVAEHRNYLEEVHTYNDEHPDEQVKPVKVLNKEEMALLDKADGKPAKPPTSAYMLYMQQYIKADEFLALSSKEKVRAIGAKWSRVSKEVKDKYEAKLTEMQQNYNEEYQAYFDKLPEEEQARLRQEMDDKKKKKKESAKKEKRQSISKRDVTLQALPKHWATMPEEDKQAYISALSRVRTHFETRKDESTKLENASQSETVDDESDDDESDDDESDDDGGHAEESTGSEDEDDNGSSSSSESD